MPAIRLLATDLDGTLIGSTDDCHLFDDFADRVHAIQKPKGQRHPRRVTRVLLIAGITYGVLLAFANFDLLPKSHLIMKPLALIIQLVEFILPI